MLFFFFDIIRNVVIRKHTCMSFLITKDDQFLNMQQSVNQYSLFN